MGWIYKQTQLTNIQGGRLPWGLLSWIYKQKKAPEDAQGAGFSAGPT
jgi:hypothetical protein